MKTKIVAAVAVAILSVSAFGYDSEERKAVKEARVELHDCLEREGDESWEAHGECWGKFGKKMSQYGVGHWRGSWDGGGWVWIVAAAIFAAVAIVSMPFLIIIALVALWRRGRRVLPGGALEILAQRFARGEIDAAEYRDRKSALKE